MRNLILTILLFFTSLSIQSAFLYNESFTNDVADEWVFDEEDNSKLPYLTSGISDSTGDGWLRLTESKKNQSTFAYYDRAFEAQNLDINISFDFAIYDGTGADGFSFFLMDASYDPDPGAFGGSLGYANRFDYNGNPVDGLSGGYLGVGFDNYGNFSNSNEGRNGGVGFVPNSISIRGSGEGTSGYEYITHANLDQYGLIGFNDQSNRPTLSDYRRASILLTADNQLTVKVQFGETNPYVTVIDDMDIDSFLYERPESLMIGFSASTGSKKEIHEIRNLIFQSKVPVIPEFDSFMLSGIAIVCLVLTNLIFFIGNKKLGKSQTLH